MEESRSHSSNKKSSSATFLIIGIVLVMVAIVALLIFFLRGESTTTGNYPEPESSESITCEATDIDYPTVNLRGASSTSIRITITFKKDVLDSIALAYSLYYDNTDEVNASEAFNHASLNLATQSEGLGPDIFNLHYNKLSDRLEFRLYTTADKIAPISAKYLLLDTYPENGTYTKSLIESTYESAGLKCLAKE